jgi:hypothetical protein
VLREEGANWFDLNGDSPYMLIVVVAQPRIRHVMPEERVPFGIDKLNVIRSVIPAVTYVDIRANKVGVTVHFPLAVDVFFALSGFVLCYSNYFGRRIA